MARSKRIIISGYYGFANTGDEAVLAAIIDGLKAQLGDAADITVLSAAPEETAELYGVKAIPRMSLGEVKKVIKDCDLLISGGGSLIQDATSVQSLIYYLSVIALAKHYGRKVMIMGQGIGPLRRNSSRKMVQFVLNRVDHITVRDADSAALLREVGVTRPPIEVTADPTFTLEPCSPDRALNLLFEIGLRESDDITAISLRDWIDIPEIEDAAVDAIKTLSLKLPGKILLVTMQSPDDEILARRVAKKTGVAVQPYLWTPSELIGVLGKCKFVVGMRLHALIFAASAQVPCIGIAYDPKVASFLSATGQAGLTLDETASGHLADQVMAAWNTRDLFASRLTGRIPLMKLSAEVNIQLAIKILWE